MDQRYLLELIPRPAFYVANGVIAEANESARQRLINVGMQIDDLLMTGKEEYSSLDDGCLFLTLSIGEITYGASVTKSGDKQLFLLETDTGNKELQAVSLAANRLREPLSNVLLIADRLVDAEDAVPKNQTAALKNSLYQILRTVYNMSDASSYATRKLSRSATENISGLVNEIMEKAGIAISDSGRKISYQPLIESVYALCDKMLLERAILNLVSNAVKFSQSGSEIQARLTRNGNKLLFTIENTCPGSRAELKNDIFTRYLREPGIEDNLNGIGLGMVIVRAAAMAHGGTVLWEIPTDNTVRLTMTVSLRRNKTSDVRSPRLSYDYAGGRDHVLIELSDVLPHTVYEDA